MMRTDYIVGGLYGSFVMASILSVLSAASGMPIGNVIIGLFYGQPGLGVVGLVGPVLLILAAFGSIASGGGTALASQALGRKDNARLPGVLF